MRPELDYAARFLAGLFWAITFTVALIGLGTILFNACTG
jgi:hypothetical protein